MAFKVPPKPQRPIPSADTHIGRLIHMFDLGSHVEEFEGEEKLLRKVRLEWELPEERAVFQEGGEPEPHIVGKELTLSMGKKAGLRQIVESMTGKKFANDAEARDFDLLSLLGQPCLITITHATSKNTGNNYAKIETIAKLMRGQEAPAQVNPTLTYQVEERKTGNWEKLPEFLQEKIEGCKEFAEF